MIFGNNIDDDRDFVERRQGSNGNTDGGERRQFGNSHVGLSPEAKELALAIDNYKAKNRRRFITCEEMLDVIKGLGYEKQPAEVE